MDLANIIQDNESEVRSYCRAFPVVFEKSKGAYLYDTKGNQYIDFFSGAGALNYGHNNDFIKDALIDYLKGDNILHGLDMYTKAKANFIDIFVNQILKPRNLDYKIQFCGGTGTNAVEAALKLARKNTGRTNVIAFMGSFHGMTLGGLAVTSHLGDRRGANVPLTDVTFMPYPVGTKNSFDTFEYLKNVLEDDHSGVDLPAAIIMETVQAEGGVNIAPIEWLKKVEALCKEKNILLIVDDIQVGCSRTGNFFSFERAGIVPDMVCLSKSISGIGLPMSILLLKPELDIWEPGEHNGTWRGNQLAFVAASKAILYNIKNNLNEVVKEKETLVKEYLENEIKPLMKGLEVRGIGLIWAIDFSNVEIKDVVERVARSCFLRGLVIEKAGRNNCCLKILPPLVIEKETLLKGLEIIRDAILDNDGKPMNDAENVYERNF